VDQAASAALILKPSAIHCTKVLRARALRALEDLHKSLKEFSKTDSVVGNAELNAEAGNVRDKAKKLRRRSEVLAARWERTFKDKA
jgi:phosphohistidine phosphatase SixA